MFFRIFMQKVNFAFLFLRKKIDSLNAVVKGFIYNFLAMLLPKVLNQRFVDFPL